MTFPFKGLEPLGRAGLAAQQRLGLWHGAADPEPPAGAGPATGDVLQWDLC